MTQPLKDQQMYLFSKDTLPQIVYRLAHCGGLLVGSQAAQVAYGGAPLEDRDWDIMVPFIHWNKARSLIPKTATLNGFRGWRLDLDCQVDVWPDDLQRYLKQAVNDTGGAAYAFDLRSNMLYSAELV